MDNFKDKNIAYQGAQGSYSHQCLLQNFPEAKFFGHTTFEGAIKSVQNGEAEYALLPVENSIAGRVTDMHHLLANSGLQILAEYYHKVNHCLLAKEGADLDKIKRAYSHPMALAQCRNFLHKHSIDIVSFTDTGDAAKFISEQDSVKVAAIAASTNADIYNGLKILAENIQDIKDNTTRFFLLGKTPNEEVRPARAGTTSTTTTPQTTAIFFMVKNIPAALFKSLSGFATNGVNVTKLESFMPLLGNGSAHFYIEVDGAPIQKNVAQALEELSYYAQKIEILGTFKKSI